MDSIAYPEMSQLFNFINDNELFTEVAPAYFLCAALSGVFGSVYQSSSAVNMY